MTPEERNAYFLEQLKIGDEWAEYVAEKIRQSGKHAEATPLEVAQSPGEVQAFTENEKDILLDQGMTLEVKSRSVSFTGVHDYPYETVFVDTVEGWLQKVANPVAVAVVSQRTGGVVMIPCKTQSLWGRRTVFDSKRGFEITVFECERNLLRSFEEFVAWL